MTRAQIEAIVAAQRRGGRSRDRRRASGPASSHFFSLAAEMAQLVDGLPLGLDDESGSVFVPVSPQEAP